MQVFIQWVLNRSQVLLPGLLLAVTCLGVVLLGYTADVVTVRRPSYGVSPEASNWLEGVSVVLNVYLMPLFLLAASLAAVNLWFSFRTCRNASTCEGKALR
jgi:hypothetical protein